MEVKATAEVSPLVSARQAMGEAARLLSDARLGEARQAAQQQALDALDQFLQEAISAAGQPSSGEAASQPSPGEPTTGSQSANGAQQGTSAGDGEPAKGEGPPSSEGSGDGPGQQPGMAPQGDDAAPAKFSPETLEKAVWGHLPARLRERLQATLPEEFLPAYDQAIRDYFTRLSEMAEADER
jgi:type II secretory pathway pseudopilin PulG